MIRKNKDKELGPTLNEQNFVDRISNKMYAFMGIASGSVLGVATMAVTAFAEDPADAADAADVTTAINQGLGAAWDIMKTIALPIAAIAAVLCAFYIITGGEKGMEKAKKIALYLIIALAVVYLGPWAVQTVSGWFNSSSASTAGAGVFS